MLRWIGLYAGLTSTRLGYSSPCSVGTKPKTEAFCWYRLYRLLPVRRSSSTLSSLWMSELFTLSLWSTATFFWSILRHSLALLPHVYIHDISIHPLQRGHISSFYTAPLGKGTLFCNLFLQHKINNVFRAVWRSSGKMLFDSQWNGQTIICSN